MAVDAFLNAAGEGHPNRLQRYSRQILMFTVQQVLILDFHCGEVEVPGHQLIQTYSPRALSHDVTSARLYGRLHLTMNIFVSVTGFRPIQIIANIGSILIDNRLDPVVVVSSRSVEK